MGLGGARSPSIRVSFRDVFGSRWEQGIWSEPAYSGTGFLTILVPGLRRRREALLCGVTYGENIAGSRRSMRRAQGILSGTFSKMKKSFP